MSWKTIALFIFIVSVSSVFFSTKPSDSLFTRLHHIFSVIRWRYHTYYGDRYTPKESTNGTKEWTFVIVADQDDRNLAHDRWTAFVNVGKLLQDRDGMYRIDLPDDVMEASTYLSRKGRSAELSDVIKWNNRLLVFCDYSGIVFELLLEDGSATLVPKCVLTRDEGSKSQPFKSEWATVKDGHLIVGSMGKEFIGDENNIVHIEDQYVKIITPVAKSFHIASECWRDNFERIKSFLNVSFPGYIIHEAVEWNPYTHEWVFAPRKLSQNDIYDEKSDETRGSNVVLFAASEGFQIIGDHFRVRPLRAIQIGTLNPSFGFSAIRRIPGTTENYIAVQTSERGFHVQSRIVVFDGRGNNLLSQQSTKTTIDGIKYEGIEFL